MTDSATPPFEDAAGQLSGIPDRIGPYHLQRVIGYGGMGVVWLAEQNEPIQRQVAVKVVRARVQTGLLRRRFEVERRVLARLNHPNIARIFDAGDLDDGRPYFVMEYLDGERIDRYCDRHQLSVNTRIRLFEQLCAGIHHAHQKAILHRDLKPSNILVCEVEGQPTIKLIDFGIARDLESSAYLTRYGVVGTPAFLSPESLSFDHGTSGSHDIRSDVYSLGVLLFVLLVGDFPWIRESLALMDWLEMIRTQPPVSASHRWRQLPQPEKLEYARNRGTTASQLERDLRRDVGKILLKAMARERYLRYGSAAELSEDLHRYLAREPVAAMPPGLLYRASKFSSRHRALLSALLLVLLVLTGGMIARSVEASRARQQAHAAEAARAEAQEVRDFLLDVLTHPQPASGATTEVPLRQVLDRGVQQIDGRFLQRPRLRANLLGYMGRAYLTLGDTETARQLLTESIALHDARDQPDGIAYGDSLLALGGVYHRQIDYEQARQHTEHALRLHREHLPPGSEKLGYTEYMLGYLYADMDEFEKATTVLQQATATWAQSLPPGDSRFLRLRRGLASVLLAQGLYDEAWSQLSEVLHLEEAQPDPDEMNIAHTLLRLGIVRMQQERYSEAEAPMRRAVDIVRRRVGTEHPNYHAFLNNLGTLYNTLGRYDDARAALEETLLLKRRALGDDNFRLVSTLRSLAETASGQGRFDEAIALNQHALRLFRTRLEPGHPEIRFVLELLVEHHERVGDAEGQAEFQQQLDSLPAPNQEKDLPGSTVVR